MRRLEHAEISALEAIDILPAGELRPRENSGIKAALCIGRLATRLDELEEQVAAAGDDRQVADLIDNQQGRASEELDALLLTARALAAGELVLRVRHHEPQNNRGFAEWAEVFGDPVVVTAPLDRLLHRAVVVQIEGSSYRLRQHAELMP